MFGKLLHRLQRVMYLECVEDSLASPEAAHIYQSVMQR